MGLIGVTALFTVMFACVWREAQALSPLAPDRIPALAGSCAVIPCSFTPVPSHSTRARSGHVGVRLRFQASAFFPLWSMAFNSEDSARIHRDFTGRTELTGDTASGDCSLTIRSINKADSNVYELGLKKQGDKKWGNAKTVHLTVSDFPEQPEVTDPGTVTDGQLVVLNCSVRYTCPSEPPTLQWRWERGGQENSSVYGETEVLQAQGQRPVLWACLSFIASYRLKPRLRCEAVYPRNRRVATVKDLHVKFQPTDVTVQVHTLTVQEGGNALLACSCKADPPVAEYLWSYTQFGRTVTLPQRTHTVRIYNVTRDMRVLCTAQNQIGRAQSRATAVNVQYKPLISHLSSSCEWDGGVVACRCAVDSNPRPAITWSVNGSHLPDDYNTSVSTRNGTLTSELTGPADTPLEVVCYAYNALGNDSHSLLQGDNGSLLWKVIPAVGITLSLLLLLSLLFLCCYRRKTGKPPTVYPENLGIYQDHTPLYINCTEVTHIYTNGSYQLVYQNCTPHFVRNKQMHKRQRRVGWRDQAVRERERPSPAATDTDTAIYMEVI